MDSYLIWIALIAISIIAIAILQIRDRRYQSLHARYKALRKEHSSLARRLEKVEEERTALQSAPPRWKKKLASLEKELKEAKAGIDYSSAERLRYLEGYVQTSLRGRSPEAVFVGSFGPSGPWTLEERLVEMVKGARFEALIVSPWIKRCGWEKIRPGLDDLVSRGGRVVVFVRAEENRLYGDDMKEEIKALGGELVIVEDLHAKIYMTDRREAIVSSANLTRGGLQGNLEAGIWTCNPLVVREVYSFIDGLYRSQKR